VLIITHLLAGLMGGTVLDYLSDKKLDFVYDRKKVIFFALLGSIFPDIDSVFLLIHGQEHIHRGILHFLGIPIILVGIFFLTKDIHILSLAYGMFSHWILDFIVWKFIPNNGMLIAIDQICAVPIILLFLYLLYNIKKGGTS